MADQTEELIKDIRQLIERSENLTEQHRDLMAKLEEALVKLGKLKPRE